MGFGDPAASGAHRRPAVRARAADAVQRVEDHFVGRFQAMGGPCEVLVDTDSPAEALTALRIAEAEARRIEAKYSRYREDSELQRLNRSGGVPVTVDEETSSLLQYAATCHATSEGRFDITSGVLRRVWRFDGGDRVPEEAAVREVLALVGWHRVTWEPPRIVLPAGMELDLGGIGKEYAVDRAAALVAREVRASYIVNFGGDLFASGPRRGGRPWGVGVDDPARTGEAALYRVDLEHGALATSGDARRYVTWRGRRLGHILDPRTGWPVEGAPRAVTVLATTCLEAGTLSTMAMLRGPDAEAFLAGQGVTYRVVA
jgi:thiamine biosynthesis lipoprotein